MMRRGGALLWLSVRTQAGPFTISIVGATLFAVMAVGGTVILGRITDQVIIPAFEEGGVSHRAVAIAAAAVMAASLLRIAGVVMRRYFGQMAQRRMQMLWFTRVTDRYLAVPLSWFDDRPTGQLLAHADADCERSTIAMQPLPFSIGVLVIIAVSMTLLAFVDPVLLAVAIGLFPGLAIINKAYTKRVEGPAAATQARVGDVSAVAHESFEAALLVKTLGLENREVARLENKADQLRQERLIVGRLRAGFEPGLDALPSLGTIALLWLGAGRLASGAITTGELVQAMVLFGILAFPFRIVGFLLEELPRAVVANERVQEVLAAPERVIPTTTVALPDGPVDVVLDAVSFAHGPDTVVEEVSVRIAPGEVVALVGATGAGKSTLCSLIAHLIDPDSGSVLIGGVPILETDPVEFHRATALVFQESFLFSDTVRENLTMGDDIDDDVIFAALDIARARTFVERLPHGLDDELGERGVTLSGGQRQRLSLARALLRQPRVLVLDDATSAVDATVERAILDGLRHSVAATTVIVAHRISTIALADRVLMLDGGRITAEGTHRELLSQPTYAALVRAYEQAPQ
jgi:ABC-type multidrug transport system fused ATPase/permease subunit